MPGEEDLCSALYSWHLWGSVCTRTLSVCCGTCPDGVCRAKGHLCSWEAVWGQEARACCKGQLSPKPGALVEPSLCRPAGLPASPGREQKGFRAARVCPQSPRCPCGTSTCLPTFHLAVPTTKGFLCQGLGRVRMEGCPQALGWLTRLVRQASLLQGSPLLPFPQELRDRADLGPGLAPCTASCVTSDR